MQHKMNVSRTSNLYILYAILALCVTQAYTAEQFMCYVCEDCAQITDNTPLEACNDAFFNPIETTVSPPVTTDEPTTQTNDISSTTEETTETTTGEISTTTSAPTPPSPPTAGPVVTTTPMPTPPTVGTTIGPILMELNMTTTAKSLTPTTSMPATTIMEPSTTAATTFLQVVNQTQLPLVRQLRAIINAEISFHCYTVQQTVNGSLKTSRGCSRIGLNEAVCPQLELANNNTKFTKCTPCTNTRCNGSGAIGASAIAVILGLLAAYLLGHKA